MQHFRIVLQTGREYQPRYDAHFANFTAEFDNDIPNNTYGQHCYDATWILALALNRTMAGNTLTNVAIYNYVQELLQTSNKRE